LGGSLIPSGGEGRAAETGIVQLIISGSFSDLLRVYLSRSFTEASMALTKADIAQKIADDCGFMKGEAAEIVEKLLDIIKTRLISGEDVLISGFGKWSVKSKERRRGRNPQTGEELVIDARKVITWHYSPVLKEAVNGGRS
jgi:integration host factor subunit alpha